MATGGIAAAPGDSNLLYYVMDLSCPKNWDGQPLLLMDQLVLWCISAQTADKTWWQVFGNQVWLGKDGESNLQLQEVQ